MPLAGCHDTGIVPMFHMIEKDLLEPENENMRYGLLEWSPTTYSPAFS